MVRSLHYAGQAAEMRVTRELRNSPQRRRDGESRQLGNLWHRWVSGTFLDAYLAIAGDRGYLPPDRVQVAQMLDFFLLEKAVYELNYEANTRPGWVDTPARGLLDISGDGI